MRFPCHNRAPDRAVQNLFKAQNRCGRGVSGCFGRGIDRAGKVPGRRPDSCRGRAGGTGGGGTGSNSFENSKGTLESARAAAPHNFLGKWEKPLQSPDIPVIIPSVADVAQSVERILGKDEVAGSIPAISSSESRPSETDPEGGIFQLFHDFFGLVHRILPLEKWGVFSPRTKAGLP